MPDLDLLVGWAPWASLAMHRGFTHGLLGGVLLMPLLLVGALMLLDRRQVARGAIGPDAPPLHAGLLLAIAYLAALTHPLLDLQNIYAVQLLAPFSNRWFHTDGLFIISPWLLAILAFGIWLARRRGSGRPAVAALVAGFAFIALNIAISALAWQAPSAKAPYANPDRVFASPEPLAFWRRDVVWRQNGAITFGSYDPLRRTTSLIRFGKPISDNMSYPSVVKAQRATPEIRKFLAWSQMPMARFEGGGDCIAFGDARFTGPTLSRSFSVATSDCAFGD